MKSDPRAFLADLGRPTALDAIYAIAAIPVCSKSTNINFIIDSMNSMNSMPSVATAPNERWSTDLCRVWAGRDGWTTLALVIDCHTRELLGWHVSRSGKATTAASALEHALSSRFGTLGKVKRKFLLRSDNGLLFNQWALHRLGPQLSAEAGVHHAPLPAAERHGRAGDPNFERAAHPSPALRQHPACNSRYR